MDKKRTKCRICGGRGFVFVNHGEEVLKDICECEEVRDNDLHNSGYEGDDRFCACGNVLGEDEGEFCEECI